MLPFLQGSYPAPIALLNLERPAPNIPATPTAPTPPHPTPPHATPPHPVPTLPGYNVNSYIEFMTTTQPNPRLSHPAGQLVLAHKGDCGIEMLPVAWQGPKDCEGSYT